MGEGPFGGGACLVTGATGMLGRQVVAHALAAGAPEVFVVVRPKAGRSAGERFDRLRRLHDGDDRLHLVEAAGIGPMALPSSVASIVNCAALVDFVDESDILESNVAATWHLLCAAARLPGLARVLHVGSLTIRTDSDAPFSEADLDTGQRFVAPYTLTKFLAEVMIRKLHRDVPVTVVRAGTILPGVADLTDTTDWFASTVKLWIQGRLSAVPMAPDQPIYPIVADDAAATLVELLAHDDLPDVLHLPAGPGEPAARVFELLGEALGIDPPRLVAQHSPEWQGFRESMAPIVRRVMDGLYPPPPPGGRLVRVDSRATERWLLGRGIVGPTVDEGYWSHLAVALEASARHRRPVAHT